MTLVIFNSETRQKEIFQPLHPNLVNMYVCGVTVYDSAHIGHARASVVFDVVRRYLEYRGYQVNFVRNFTDIDDKIIHRSHAENCDWKKITEKYIDEYTRDMKSLAVLCPSHEPRATEYISQMIDMISKLIQKDLAYPAVSGVYFRVQRFLKYGRLSGRSLNEMVFGTRIETEEGKEHPGDFALWKTSKLGEPAWPSPWGDGRPGWHIECSVMSTGLLGEEIDIHGGGADLLFPHHENEIAQSEGANGRRFVRYWMHNEMVTFGREKMSKSLKNTTLISELTKKYSATIIRYFLLSKHYRSPIEFNEKTMQDAGAAVHRFEELLSRFQDVLDVKIGLEEFLEFQQAMDDDFSTPEAVASIMKKVREANKALDENQKELAYQKVTAVRQMLKVLGLEIVIHQEKNIQVVEAEDSVETLFAKENLLDKDIEQLLYYRNQFRKEKKWDKADEVRLFLQKNQIIIKDNPQGSTWIKTNG